MKVSTSSIKIPEPIKVFGRMCKLVTLWSAGIAAYLVSLAMFGVGLYEVIGGWVFIPVGLIVAATLGTLIHYGEEADKAEKKKKTLFCHQCGKSVKDATVPKCKETGCPLSDKDDDDNTAITVGAATAAGSAIAIAMGS